MSNEAAAVQRAKTRIEGVGDLPLTARNATLGDLANILREQHARKVDVVAPASAIRSDGGVWHISGTEPIIEDDGVTMGDGRYRPTRVADEGVADKLSIPTAYLRRLREDRVDLYDANVNGLLHGYVPGQVGINDTPPRGRGTTDPRSFLIRAFKGDNGEGVARAFLSDRYRIMDHLDVLTAALDGIRDSGAEVEVTECDLTERRMYVKVSAPGIVAYAPSLLEGYRSPFSGEQVGRGWTPERVAAAAAREGQSVGDVPPIVFAGFVVSNSETGGGALTITPRLTIKVCNNGLTITADALRNVHLGGKMDDGVIRWSADTQRKNLQLVTAQARDAVTTFLDVEYVQSKVAEIEAKAGTPVVDAAKTVKVVAQNLSLTAETDALLDHFIRGGQPTAGGVMQAVTSFAQTVEDADRAAEIEAQAMTALTVAAAR